MNIVDLISFKGKTALMERVNYRTYSISYKELLSRIKKTETHLLKKAKKGDKVVVQEKNSINYVTLMLACLRQGIIFVPLDVNTSEKQRKKIIKEVKPKFTFTDLNGFEDNIVDLKENEKISNIKDTDTAEIIYTSGTTGTPKGVELSHENLLTVVRKLKKYMFLKLNYLSVLPISHMLEQSAGLFLPLATNSTILYLDSYRYSDIIDSIRYKKINAMICVPAILDGLKSAVENRNKSFRKLFGWRFRFVGVGGAYLPKETEKWWSKRVFLFQGYGLTETSPLISFNFIFRRKKFSIGKPIADVRIKNGEIQVKGNQVMKGYYKKPKETKKVFEKEWFKTGDIGEMKRGYLFFKGRKKDIIVSPSGLNVYPKDVEKVLDKYVSESCVIEKDGNIHAVLVTDKKPSEVIKKANKQLESHQKIDSFSVWPGRLPRTTTGKLKRFQVSKDIDSSVQKYKDPLKQILANSLKNKIKNKSLSEQGMDSLKRVELISKIEQQYGVELSETDISEKTTPKKLKKIIKEKSRIYHYDFKLPKLAFVGRIIGWIIVTIFCRVKCFKQKFHGIIVSNHVSALDVPVILKCVKTKYAVSGLPDYVFGIGTDNFSNKLRGFFVKNFFNAYPLGAEVGIENSLRFTGHLLDEGYSIIMFPEGQRTRNGEIGKFKEGVGLLSQKMDAEMLPLKTKGLFEILPWDKTIPKFGIVKVKTGKPFRLDKMSYFNATKKIKKKVKEL